MSHGSSSSDPLGIAMPAGALGGVDSSFDYTNSSSESNEEAKYGPLGRAPQAAVARHAHPWQPLGKTLTPIAASPSRSHDSRSGSAPPRRGSNPYTLACDHHSKTSARGTPDAPLTGKQKRGTSRPLASDGKAVSSSGGSGGALARSKMVDVQPALENAPVQQAAAEAADEEENSAKKQKEEYSKVSPSWSVLTMSGSSLAQMPARAALTIPSLSEMMAPQLKNAIADAVKEVDKPTTLSDDRVISPSGGSEVDLSVQPVVAPGNVSSSGGSIAVGVTTAAPVDPAVVSSSGGSGGVVLTGPQKSTSSADGPAVVSSSGGSGGVVLSTPVVPKIDLEGMKKNSRKRSASRASGQHLPRSGRSTGDCATTLCWPAAATPLWVAATGPSRWFCYSGHCDLPWWVAVVRS